MTPLPPRSLSSPARRRQVAVALFHRVCIGSRVGHIAWRMTRSRLRPHVQADPTSWPLATTLAVHDAAVGSQSDPFYDFGTDSAKVQIAGLQHGSVRLPRMMPSGQKSLDAAGTARTRAYITDRDLHYYLLTGKLRGADKLEALISTRISTANGTFCVMPVWQSSAATLESEPPRRPSTLRVGGNPLPDSRTKRVLDRRDAVCRLARRQRFLESGHCSQIERLLLELNGELMPDGMPAW